MKRAHPRQLDNGTERNSCTPALEISDVELLKFLITSSFIMPLLVCLLRIMNHYGSP